MSEWYDNRSAEVVLRQPRAWSHERKCLEGCLKRLKPRERELIFRPVGEQRDPKDLAASRGVSIIQLKKIRSRLVTCLEGCLKEVEENVL
jgi:DNA-directed RNA polymerase specialized sigma24 family protein